MNGKGVAIAEPRKEYRARIWVRLTDELLPTPQLSKDQLQAMIADALQVGQAGSPVVSVAVEDPRR